LKSSGVRIYFIIAVSLLIFVVLGVTGGLNIASFKQNYTQSLISSYGVLGGETVKKIEYAVKYGKPLSNFYGIEELIGQIKEDSSSIEQVYVLHNDGTSIYDLSGPISGRKVAPDLWSKVDFKDATSNAKFISLIDQDKYHLYLPIRDRAGDWIGNLELVFDKSVIKNSTDAYMDRLILLLCGFAFLSVIFLLFFIFRVSLIDEHGGVRKKRLLIFIFTLLGFIQLSFGAVNYTMLKSGYLEIIKDNTSVILKVVERDIESVVDKGVPYSKLYGVGDYLGRLIESVPEIDRISVIDSGYTSERLVDETQTSIYTYSVPLATDRDGHDNYRTVVDLSQSFINGKMREMLLDTLTMLIISFLLMVEITLFVFILLSRKVKVQHGGDAEQILAEARNDRTVIRPLGFLVFTSLYMSTAFIPVLMKSIYKPMFGLSEQVVIGLPISAELLFMAIASMFAGYMVDKRGWKPVFTMGCVILGIGTIASGLAWEPLGFILSRAVTGFGFGLSLMSMQAFVVTAPSESGKNDALAALNSGAYAGINCGVVVGAMLADRIGFAQVFFIAFAIIGLGGLFAMKWMQNVKSRRDDTVVVTLSTDVVNSEGIAEYPIKLSRKERLEIARLERLKEKQSVGGFLGNINVITYFIFLLIPMSICTMFLYYFFPLFAESNGLSPSNIGRAFLLYGLCIVYLGPILTKVTEKLLGVRMAVVCSAAIIIGALLLFSSFPSMTTAFVAVILLGIAEGFGLTASINYYISLRASQWLGEGKAMGYWSLVENFGQMMGPMLFGSLLILGTSNASAAIGIMMAAGIFLFLISGKREQRLPATTSIGGEVQ
jgi:MFS family permease